MLRSLAFALVIALFGSVALPSAEAGSCKPSAADLTAILPPDQFRIETRIVQEPGAALDATEDATPVLFSPRLWWRLSEEQKQHPRAYEVRYVIAADDLRHLGRRFAWRPRSAAVTGSAT